LTRSNNKTYISDNHINKALTKYYPSYPDSYLAYTYRGLRSLKTEPQRSMQNAYKHYISYNQILCISTKASQQFLGNFIYTKIALHQ